MAGVLKRQYDLVVLKIGLTLPTGDRTSVGVACDIEAKIDGNLTTIAHKDFLPADFGIPKRLDARQERYSGYKFCVPDEFLSMVRTTLTKTELAGRPLWLHLVAPYGYLGIVPWERLLVPQFGVPILRLPDFVVPPPKEVQQSLDVVLCCSMPAAKDSFDAVEHMKRIVTRIAEANVRQRVTIHLFTDAEFFYYLQSNTWSSPPSIRLEVHKPDERYEIPEASTQIENPGGWLVNPWLLWMRDALQGRSIDVVHFLCHGYFANERGALAFGASPARNEDPKLARFVGTSELDTFVTQVGAWSCVFSSPERNFSEIGLRLVSETLAQLRPLTIFHHDVALDIFFDALGEGYSFLYADRPTHPPVSPSNTFYCQPYRVPATEAVNSTHFPHFATDYPDMPASSSLAIDELADETGEIPSWLAAGERFIEQQQLEFNRATRLNPSNIFHLGVTYGKTLQQMQEILARSALDRKKGLS